MKSAIPGSLNFGKNHRGLPLKRCTRQFPSSSKLALVGRETKKRTPLDPFGFVANCHLNRSKIKTVLRSFRYEGNSRERR